MDGKFFLDYAKITFNRAYDDINYIDNKWINPRIMPLYKSLKFRGTYRDSYVNSFIHPDDADVEYYQDLKHGSWDF